MENIYKVFIRLFQCKSTESTNPTQTSLIDESVDSTSEVLVSIRISASLSFEVKAYDTSRAYFQGTM